MLPMLLTPLILMAQDQFVNAVQGPAAQNQVQGPANNNAPVGQNVPIQPQQQPAPANQSLLV